MDWVSDAAREIITLTNLHYTVVRKEGHPGVSIQDISGIITKHLVKSATVEVKTENEGGN